MGGRQESDRDDGRHQTGAQGPEAADRRTLIGRFEAHLTVATDDIASFERACGELGVECVVIALAAGAHALQPMTASHHTGELAEVVAEVDALRERLVARGFAVVRTKIETEAATPGIDATTGGYFEFHAKVVADDVAALRAIAVAHRAHVSANERRPGQRFVTLRVYRADRAAAEGELAGLERAIAGGGFAITGVIREYTLVDSRAELDAGWLDP